MPRGARRLGWLIAWLLPAASLAGQGSGTPLAMIEKVRETHPRVQAAKQALVQARKKYSAAEGAWYPQLDARAKYGREVEEGEASRDEDLKKARNASLSVTQLVTDFGATNARLEAADRRVARARLGLEKARLEQVFQAASAWVRLHQARQRLAYAESSENNIREQADVERVRVDTGSGVNADLLQAKRQLAGARARRVQAQSAVDRARNRFRSLFQRSPPRQGTMVTLKVADEALPESVTRAVKRARQNSLDLLQVREGVAVARAERREQTRSAYGPTLELVGDRTWREDDQGVPGSAREWSVTLQLRFPFNLGFTARDETSAALAREDEALDQLRAQVRQVKRKVRSAWDSYRAARSRVRELSEQAELAQAFLDVARKERKLGKRSLIDVLSGETSLINARSAAASARESVTLKALELLRLMGGLDVSDLRVAEAEPVQPPPDTDSATATEGQGPQNSGSEDGG